MSSLVALSRDSFARAGCGLPPRSATGNRSRRRRSHGQGRGDLAAVADATGCQHGVSPIASTICGHSTMEPTLPVWPPPSPPWATNEIQPCLLVGHRLFHFAAKGRHQPARILHQLYLVRRRVPRALAIMTHRGRVRPLPGGAWQWRRSTPSAPCSCCHRARAAPGIRQQLLGKIHVLPGHHLPQPGLHLFG